MAFGWGRGPCGTGSAWPRGGFAAGWGRGGGGRGWRNRFWATGRPGWAVGWAGTAEEPFAPATEREDLERRCALLESELEAMRRRLSELEGGGEAE